MKTWAWGSSTSGNPPFRTALLHNEGKEDWALEYAVLEYIDESVNADSVTAETGAGLSTVLLASKGCQHHAVTPSASEIEAIHAVCRERGIDATGVTFHVGNSEDVLPHLSIPPLDLVIIDGGHGFPIPFVDWCYLAPRLKVGGILIVDDIQLWTGRVLSEFLRAEMRWAFVRLFAKTMVFRKNSDPVLNDWGHQPYLMANSQVPADWRWRTNELHGHVSAIRNVLDQIAQQGSENADKVERLRSVEAELMDCCRRIAALCEAKRRES
jgi:hypothetical protein